MRLIDADALIADLLTVDPRYTEMVEWCCNVIRQTPTIEPTDTDLISRKSLNDIKFIAIKGDKVEEAYRSGWNGAIECIIENAPFEEKLAEREWIPCSERLPTENGTYIVTIADNTIQRKERTMTREEAIAILEVSKHMATSGKMYNQAIDMAIDALKEQAEWKYVEKDGNPKEMGTYYCLIVAPSEYNGKTIPHYEYDQRWFGEGETAQAWKMDGQPDNGLVWTEQTGSMEGEQVYAWRELPDTETCLIDPQAFERICEIK